MSNCFVFTDKSSVAESASLAWTNQGSVSTSFNVSNNGDCSMTDSINDSYATAIDENETQYLSVLNSTSDVTLEDLHNLTIGNPKLVEQENLQAEPADIPEECDDNLTDAGDQQVVIFNMEGSDDLYGIQFAQDEEGIIHKYQFQVRTNDEGQFEAIPETIQLLPEETNDSEDLHENASEQTPESAENNNETLEEVVFETQVFVQEETDQSTETQMYIQNEEDVIEEVQTENEDQTEENSDTVFVFIKSEPTTGGNQIDENEAELEDEDTPGVGESSEYAQDDEAIEYAQDDEAIDVKPSVMETSFTTNIKREYHIQDQIAQEVESQRQAEEIIYETSDLLEEHSGGILLQGNHTEADEYDPIAPDAETILEYQHFDSPNVEICEEAEERSEDGSGEDLGRSRGLEEGGAVGEHYLAENDSDSEGYEMGEGLHVTAEGDISESPSSPEYQTIETIYQEPDQVVEEQTAPLKKQTNCLVTNVLKQPMHTNNMDNFSNKTILYYMITNTEQKENVISMPLNNTVLTFKPNPRSLLKHVAEAENVSNGPLRAKEKSKDLKISPSQRRFARSSEFVQAKLFNNFINKTTISQAPIRQIRLPRKQEIKPVDTRRNEEIIVKEVMVSSKGFVENVNDRLNSRDKLEITSIVELTDSDDEREARNGTKKKKKHRKSTPRHGADSTVIEILQSDDDGGGENDAGRRPSDDGVAKRGRGRPRKNEAVVVDGAKRPRGRPPKATAASPQKKSRTESSELESDQGKTEINCPHCPKSFPSQNSLSTHIHHHSLENSLKNAKTPQIEYKHKCDTCQDTFKNSILLKRHVCQKNNPKPKCTVCSKTFDDISALTVHKRTHLKENLVKSTSTVTISPKKFKPRSSTAHVFKSPKKLTTFKCKHCSKVCSSQAILTTHERTHKSFSCVTCKAAFASKLLLDTHLRISCVKTGSPKDKRLSFKIRKSFVSSPKWGRPPRTSTVPTRTSMVPPRTSTVSTRTSMVPPRTSRVPTRTLAPTGSAKHSLVSSKDSGEYGSFLDLKFQCPSCSMKFSTMKALFKHEVKEHGVNTPDKTVLLPEKKQIHKPLNQHGGIPLTGRLNKFFQGYRGEPASNGK